MLVQSAYWYRYPTMLHNSHIQGLRELLYKGNKSVSILYKVPIADVKEVWEAQKAKYEVDLQEALATQQELRSKGVDDSCTNGKVDNARVNIGMISLQLKYIAEDQEIFMQDHEMYGLFGTHRSLGPGDNPQVATERRY